MCFDNLFGFVITVHNYLVDVAERIGDRVQNHHFRRIRPIPEPPRRYFLRRREAVQNVAFHASTQVQVYNTDSLTRTRTVELGHKTRWIACHGGLLYCAGMCGDIVYVHDVSSGRKLREISMDTDGRKLFSSIRHIAVNSSGERVYVADGERGLLCVGTDGRRIFHLSHQDLGLTRAYGVTTDHRGHVYVCGRNSYNVVKVTEDGHVVGQILSKEDGITWSPECLSYDVSRNQLCVGGESDQLLMVEL